MYHRNEPQEDLYQQYTIIGKEIKKYWLKSKNIRLTHQYGWRLITQQGIWKLLINKQYTGLDFNWQACLLALEGLNAFFKDPEFSCKIISQLGYIYLTSKYGEKENKKFYLQRLMKGEIYSAYETIFHSSKESNVILCDYINFKHLFHGLITAKLEKSILSKCQNNNLHANYKEVERKIMQCEKIFYSAISS